MGWWRKRLKGSAARLIRPGLAGVEQRLEKLEGAVRAIGSRLESMDARIPVAPRDAPARKYEEELAYWRWLIKTDEGRRALPGPFAAVFGGWQRERLRELAGILGLTGDGASERDRALDAWCAERSVVEIGGGPYPAVAAAPRWRRAVAVDPLARGYAREGLLLGGDHERSPHECITHVEACGESVPLPDRCADLVIIENALDHVSDPVAVVGECRRLLREGGLLWLLVDLSNHRDPMHPHPFDESRVRRLLDDAGFEVVRDRVSAHHSHPKAYGEYRGLLRRPTGGAPTVEVKAGTPVSAAVGGERC